MPFYAAMGAFENELENTEPRARPQVELRPIGTSGVLMALFRTILEKQYHDEALNEAEILRAGLERHFNDADRARLSKRFAGFVVSKGLMIE